MTQNPKPQNGGTQNVLLHHVRPGPRRHREHPGIHPQQRLQPLRLRRSRQPLQGPERLPRPLRLLLLRPDLPPPVRPEQPRLCRTLQNRCRHHAAGDAQRSAAGTGAGARGPARKAVALALQARQADRLRDIPGQRGRHQKRPAAPGPDRLLPRLHTFPRFQHRRLQRRPMGHDLPPPPDTFAGRTGQQSDPTP